MHMSVRDSWATSRDLAVVEAAVIGVPDKRWGKSVRALVPLSAVSRPELSAQPFDCSAGCVLDLLKAAAK
jgi:acyl-CoA synthetase (AMP-forming)/AMP-acid ligase II